MIRGLCRALGRFLTWVFDDAAHSAEDCMLCNAEEQPVEAQDAPGPGALRAPTLDGWRQMVVEDGKLLFAQPGASEPLRLTLDEARAKMPDWEFMVDEQDGEQRVWAR